jgi:polysaccharide deacetylase family protein (PEP-CTERM system associated)
VNSTASADSRRTPYILSVDVEDYFQVEAFSDQVRREDWPNMPRRVVPNTQRVLELLARHGQHGTFFVIGWIAEQHPELVREIQAAGHEVACHSFLHRLVYDLRPEEFREDTRRAKAVLEDAAGVAVVGYRAPCYSITRKSLWALEILAEEGFQYDSSIQPIRHDIAGIPDYPRTPNVHEFSGGKSILEFPATTLRYAGMNLPVGGGGYLRIFPLRYSLWGLAKLGKEPGLFPAVYFHPWEIDPQQPRIAGRIRSHLRHYTNLSRMEGKLDCVLGRFLFTRYVDVLNSRNEAFGTILAATA